MNDAFNLKFSATVILNFSLLKNYQIYSTHMEKPVKKNLLFEPGTCVMLDGFVNKPEYNGMLGQIKKHIKDDTYRVMLSSKDAEIAVRTEFLNPVEHCPNSRRGNTIGVLVWPDVARSDYPGVQYFDYRVVLQTCRENSQKWLK